MTSAQRSFGRAPAFPASSKTCTRKVLIRASGYASLAESHTLSLNPHSKLLDITNPVHPGRAQKIVTADFSFPPGVGVSEEVRDLLQRIFVVNAAHRLNLEGIKAHPWFLRNLPAELQARPRP